MSLEERFHAAVKLIRRLPMNGPYKASNSTKLKFYSLFKQATEGPCQQSKPGFWDIVGRAKWEAWTQLGDMSASEAMAVYIDEFKKITSGIPNIRDYLDPEPAEHSGRSGNYSIKNTTQQAVPLI